MWLPPMISGMMRDFFLGGLLVVCHFPLTNGPPSLWWTCRARRHPFAAGPFLRSESGTAPVVKRNGNGWGGRRWRLPDGGHSSVHRRRAKSGTLRIPEHRQQQRCVGTALLVRPRCCGDLLASMGRASVHLRRDRPQRRRWPAASSRSPVGDTTIHGIMRWTGTDWAPLGTGLSGSMPPPRHPLPACHDRAERRPGGGGRTSKRRHPASLVGRCAMARHRCEAARFSAWRIRQRML